MKNIILLFITCMFLLDVTSAMQKEHAESPPLPRNFPSNSAIYFYIQKNDGNVYFGYLQNIGRTAPEWAKNREVGTSNSAEHVLVRMPSGIKYISNVQRLQRPVDINDTIPEEHRCFILYGNDTILVADLQPFNQLKRRITSPLGIQVRMPDEHNHLYLGGFEHYDGPRLSWLKAF